MASVLPITVTALPDKEALLKCFQSVTLPEVADYMTVKLEKILKQSGKEIYNNAQPLLKKFEEFALNVHLERDSKVDYWSGNTEHVRTDFENLQHNLSEVAIQTIESSDTGLIKMDFAINDDSNLLRGYSSFGEIDASLLNAVNAILSAEEGSLEEKANQLYELLKDTEGNAKAAVPLEAAQIDAMDKLFNAWLAEKNLLSKDSVIYEVTKKGEIRQDANGNPIKANAERVRAMINDPKNGFYKTLQAKGVQIITQQHDYPSAQPVQAVQKTAEPTQQVPTPTRPSEEAGGPQPSESPHTGRSR